MLCWPPLAFFAANYLYRDYPATSLRSQATRQALHVPLHRGASRCALGNPFPCQKRPGLETCANGEYDSTTQTGDPFFSFGTMRMCCWYSIYRSTYYDDVLVFYFALPSLYLLLPLYTRALERLSKASSEDFFPGPIFVIKKRSKWIYVEKTHFYPMNDKYFSTRWIFFFVTMIIRSIAP